MHAPIADRRRVGPDEATPLQTFGKQAQPVATPPKKFDLVAAPTTKHEDVTGEDALGAVVADLAIGVSFAAVVTATCVDLVLYQCDESVKAFPHVGDACG